MDAALKAKWIAALRSGEFKQGYTMLHNQKDDTYCCLGVLCKVAGAEFTECEELGDDETGPLCFSHVPVLAGRILSHRGDEELKSSVCEDFGIPDQSILIGLNDGKHAPNNPAHEPPQPFAIIADYIEKNL
jgi:hypothetical protein